MVDMDVFGAGGDVGGAPNTQNLRQLGDAPTGLIHCLVSFSHFSLIGVCFFGL